MRSIDGRGVGELRLGATVNTILAVLGEPVGRSDRDPEIVLEYTEGFFWFDQRGLFAIYLVDPNIGSTSNGSRFGDSPAIVAANEGTLFYASESEAWFAEGDPNLRFQFQRPTVFARTNTPTTISEIYGFEDPEHAKVSALIVTSEPTEGWGPGGVLIHFP